MQVDSIPGSGRSPGKGIGYPLQLEKAMVPHSSTLAWKLPGTEEPGRLQSMGSLSVRHDWVTSLSPFTFMHWRRKWQPTAVFLPGESQRQESLVGCCLWGRTVRDDWVTELNWPTPVFLGFPAGSDGKESACNAGDLGSAPGLGRSPGGGHGNPVQHSCLENPHGRRNLAGYSLWGHKESDMTEQLSTAQNYYMTQQSHLCICIQNNWKQDLREISAHPCSLPHYSQLPRGGSNTNVHQWMDG